MENSKKTMEKIVALCKTRGFIFPGSEIYGGLANSWDYGPLGVEFKNNVKRERSATLIAAKNAVRDEVLSEVVSSGKILSCIAETRDKNGFYTAHSDSYIEVRFEGKSGLSGEVISVVPTSHKDGIIYGNIQ